MHGECEEVLFEVCVFCYVDIELTKHSLDNCRRDSRIIVICFDTEMEKKRSQWFTKDAAYGKFLWYSFDGKDMETLHLFKIWYAQYANILCAFLM